MHSDNAKKMPLTHTVAVPSVSNQAMFSVEVLGDPPRPPGWILQDPDVIEQIDRSALMLSRRCGHTSSDLEDIKQDIRLHLFLKESDFDPNRGTPGAYANSVLRTWLWTTLRYLQRQRRRGRMNQRSLCMVGEPLAQGGADQASEPVVAADLLSACLARLSDEEFWVLMHRFEFGQVRAAKMTGVSRRQICHTVTFIRASCSDLHPYSEKADRV